MQSSIVTSLRLWLVVLSLGSLLAGCVPAIGPHSCPKLIPHTQEFWNRVADAIDSVSTQYPEIVTLVDDYNLTIKQIRRCIEAQRGHAK
jgi:hypothetical protein